jgi:hypothetical protein
MTRPLDIFKSCPKHNTYVIPYKFERWEVSQGAVDGFRCPNLSCRIVYIDGDAEGFYMLEPNGGLAPYMKSGQH